MNHVNLHKTIAHHFGVSVAAVRSWDRWICEAIDLAGLDVIGGGQYEEALRSFGSAVANNPSVTARKQWVATYAHQLSANLKQN